MLKIYAKNHHQTDSDVIRDLIATLAFKSTPDELKKAKKEQAKADVELTKAVQENTKKMDEIIAIKQATYFLIKNLTNNLNQIAHWINLYGENAYFAALKQQLSQIREQERKITQEIKRIDAKHGPISS